MDARDDEVVEHFVFAKPVPGGTGGELDAGFRVVALSPGLDVESADRFQRELWIGQSAEVGEGFHCFLACGLGEYDVFAHFLRSPEVPRGRSHYVFLHCLVLNQHTRDHLGAGVAALVRGDLSAAVYRTYEIPESGGNPEVLTRFRISATQAESQASPEVEAFMARNETNVKLLSESLAAGHRVYVTGFEGGPQEMSMSLRVLFERLPERQSRHLSFATTVLARPENCPAQLQFLGPRCGPPTILGHRAITLAWNRSELVRRPAATPRIPPAAESAVAQPEFGDPVSRVERAGGSQSPSGIPPAVESRGRAEHEYVEGKPALGRGYFDSALFALELEKDAPSERQFLDRVKEFCCFTTVADLDSLIESLRAPRQSVYRRTLLRAILAREIDCPPKVYLDVLRRQLREVLGAIANLEIVDWQNVEQEAARYPELSELEDDCHAVIEKLDRGSAFKRRTTIVDHCRKVCAIAQRRTKGR